MAIDRPDAKAVIAPAPTATGAYVSPTLAHAPYLRTRKLGVAHFAFMRALVQGVPLRDAWDRYLQVEGKSTDLRVVRSTISWIRGAFAAAARRESRFGTARLFLFDASSMGAEDVERPSLEAFAEDRGLEEFSQAEQIEAYEAAFGARNPRDGRRSRLIARQLEALRWLERTTAQPPGPGDSVSAWFSPGLAGRLEAADIFTLTQLADRINGLGRGWTRSIKGVGKGKAEHVVRWLRGHEDSLGVRLGPHASLPRERVYRHELDRVVAPATDVRPLEKLVVPADLDGRAGAYRRPQAHCLMSAQNDYQAVLAWLRTKSTLDEPERAALRARRRGQDLGMPGPLDWLSELSHTQRAYRKEAERLLLWAVVERRKPLSSLTAEDCAAYRDFLADPQPRGRWCGPRGRERWSPLWRPFEGPLSPAGQRQAITVLRNLYGYWVDMNYTMGNPWRGLPVTTVNRPRLNTGRSLTLAQWRFVLSQSQLLPETSVTLRLRFALALVYGCGLRLSEAVAARVADLEWVEYPPDEDDSDHVTGWVLNVVGKGKRLRQVPVPRQVVAHLPHYLRSRGLDGDLHAPSIASAYLLGKSSDLADRPGAARISSSQLNAAEGIVAGTLYDQFSAFFADCSAALQQRGDAKGAARLARASTHWLRHSFATHAIAKGMRVEIAQQLLGHASLATTTLYITTEQKRRMKAIAALEDS